METLKGEGHSLNKYLHQYASQDIKRGINKVFIASPPKAPQQIIGYYSLSACSLNANDLPSKVRSRLPKYPVPVALLGRPAVAKPHQGQGLESIMLVNAMQRIVQASHTMAVYAVVVDALDDRSAKFYQKFDFIPLPSQPLKLFLPLNSAAALFD